MFRISWSVVCELFIGLLMLSNGSLTCFVVFSFLLLRQPHRAADTLFSYAPFIALLTSCRSAGLAHADELGISISELVTTLWSIFLEAVNFGVALLPLTCEVIVKSFRAFIQVMEAVSSGRSPSELS